MARASASARSWRILVGVALLLVWPGVDARGLAAELPPAGGLQSLPPERTEPVALVNTGFEEGLNGWQPARPEAFSLQQTQAHEGQTCLRLDTGAATKYVPSVSQPIPDAPSIVTSVSDERVRWRARAAAGKWYLFAYLPAEKFGERFDAAPVRIAFALKDGQQVEREFRPDTASWFQVTPTQLPR